MKKVIKYVFILALIFGGWALAAASLHIVRAPGKTLEYIPLKVQLVPKSTLTFRETYVDTTKWTVADVDAHPAFKDRLQQAGKLDLLSDAIATPAPKPTITVGRDSTVSLQSGKPAVEITPAPKVETPAPAPTTTGERKPTSIFDFSNEKKK